MILFTTVEVLKPIYKETEKEEDYDPLTRRVLNDIGGFDEYKEDTTESEVLAAEAIIDFERNILYYGGDNVTYIEKFKPGKTVKTYHNIEDIRQLYINYYREYSEDIEGEGEYIASEDMTAQDIDKYEAELIEHVKDECDRLRQALKQG